eukprot:360745-Chlamydomonas_euryale.AAC.3
MNSGFGSESDSDSDSDMNSGFGSEPDTGSDSDYGSARNVITDDRLVEPAALEQLLGRMENAECSTQQLPEEEQHAQRRCSAADP